MIFCGNTNWVQHGRFFFVICFEYLKLICVFLGVFFGIVHDVDIIFHHCQLLTASENLF